MLRVIGKSLAVTDPDRNTARLHELVGLALVAVAILFQAIHLAPELRIGVLPPNDAVLHRIASERLGESLVNGEPFLEPWVSEWSLGYPVWRSYQPIPHLFASVVLAVSSRPADVTFAALQYLLFVLFPLSFYLGARLLGLGPGGAGIAALLSILPSEAGELGRYGLGYGSMIWRGSGLYTQIFALHLLLPTIGFVARALDTGRRPVVASFLLALTSLSHIVFGYVAFVSAAVLVLTGPAGKRSSRLVRLMRIVLPALFLLSWFLVPLFADRAHVNSSRWEDPYKWDSFGAPRLLSELGSGALFDAGRAPVLTLLVGFAALVALASLSNVTARRLLALSTLWLLLFFGRATWGRLLYLALVPDEFHVHRLEAAFEVAAILLAGWGVAHALGRASRRVAVAGAVALAVVVTPLYLERARYLAENAAWGEANLDAHQSESADLELALADLRALLDARPGRTSAGKAATWGRDFKIGSMHLYSMLTLNRFDHVSFLYHSMSRSSDVMVLRDESSQAHDVAFGVRGVLAPAEQEMPAHLRRISSHGRFAVYESSGEGYIGLVDVIAGAPEEAWYERSVDWLRSPLVANGSVLALGPSASGFPLLEPGHRLPSVPDAAKVPRGTVVREWKEHETIHATLQLERACYALVKVNWHPDLVATVDQEPVPMLYVTPGFGAVPVTAGRHEIEIAYQPGRTKPVLFAVAFFLVPLLGIPRVSRRLREREEGLARQTRTLAGRFATPRSAAALALIVLSLVALRPLFRGQLIDGHDALEYPPRLVEFARVVTDGQIPPVWAPDLGNGHGQPLFQFAPPLLYLAALPLYLSGFGLVDSVQLGLALLHIIGGLAVYRICRRHETDRVFAVSGAVAWLFVPYLALDIAVRSAYAEAAAVAVAPIALFLLLRCLDRPSVARVGAAGSGIALVVLGHNAAALLLIPSFVVIVTAMALADRRRLMFGYAAVATGIGLSAFFWAPALFEKSNVKVDLLREGFLNWSEHSVTPGQLFTWRWGHGLSLPGGGDEMSFQLGLVHLALAGIGLVAAWRSDDSTRRRELFAFAFLAAMGAWLATTLASPVWSRVQTLQFMAYPWRALLLPALFVPLLVSRGCERLGLRWSATALAFLILVNLPHTEPRGYRPIADEEWSADQIAKRGVNTTTREEYEPRWVESRPPYSAVRLRAMQGTGVVGASVIQSDYQRLELALTQDGVVEAATFHYPGWRILVDGEPVSHEVVPGRGTMAFETTAGDHVVELELRSTPLRRAANVASLLVAIGLFIGVVAERRRGFGKLR